MSEQNNKNRNDNCIKFEDLEKFIENRKIDELNESIEELSKLRKELEKINKNFFKKRECVYCVFISILFLFFIIFIFTFILVL